MFDVSFLPLTFPVKIPSFLRLNTYMMMASTNPAFHTRMLSGQPVPTLAELNIINSLVLSQCYFQIFFIHIKYIDDFKIKMEFLRRQLVLLSQRQQMVNSCSYGKYYFLFMVNICSAYLCGLFVMLKFIVECTSVNCFRFVQYLQDFRVSATEYLSIPKF